MRRCRDRGIKVGLRFTVTERNVESLPAMLDLMEAEGSTSSTCRTSTTPAAATATAMPTPTTAPRAR